MCSSQGIRLQGLLPSCFLGPLLSYSNCSSIPADPPLLRCSVGLIMKFMQQILLLQHWSLGKVRNDGGYQELANVCNSMLPLVYKPAAVTSMTETEFIIQPNVDATMICLSQSSCGVEGLVLNASQSLPAESGGPLH